MDSPNISMDRHGPSLTISWNIHWLERETKEYCWQCWFHSIICWWAIWQSLLLPSSAQNSSELQIECVHSVKSQFGACGCRFTLNLAALRQTSLSHCLQLPQDVIYTLESRVRISVTDIWISVFSSQLSERNCTTVCQVGSGRDIERIIAKLWKQWGLPSCSYFFNNSWF